MTKELAHFQPLHGADFYQTDDRFRQLLDRLAPAGERVSLEERLTAFSKKVSGLWDLLAEEIAIRSPGPEIERYDRSGNPIDRIRLSAPLRQLRREVVEAGIFENRSELEQFAKAYLLAHLGEISVNCPLACTLGLIRVIEAVGSDSLKKTILPKLRSSETPLAGSQFITEQDMGSDVGALTTRAVPEGDGKWRLTGEKWFCSAIDEYFLVAARPEGAPAGTAGVAIFFVPRVVDGKLNGLRIKRLKEKIGTRELPTAEIELEGALAWNIGPVENGFKGLMNHVLNTSRLMNAADACGIISRALLEARNYACQRSAFGKKIIEQPMVQESLTKIEKLLTSRRSLFFHLVAGREGQEALWKRFLINLCKYRTAIAATEATHEAILILGGNGTIENFSILPRLYRDSIVLETWEGTHNTLALQICRDGLRFPFRDCFEENLKRWGGAQWGGAQWGGAKWGGAKWLDEEWKKTSPLFDRLTDPQWVASEARHFVDRLGNLLEVAVDPLPS